MRQGGGFTIMSFGGCDHTAERRTCMRNTDIHNHRLLVSGGKKSSKKFSWPLRLLSLSFRRHIDRKHC
jgi:hypothetical protein